MKKTTLILLCCLLIASVIAGCSGNVVPSENNTANQSNNVSQNTNADASADDMSETIKINLMTRSYAGGGWPPTHPIIDELNKKLNIDLKIEWVPAANYQEKLNVLAASNNFPDVFYITNSEFVKWQEKGIFMDVKPVLKDYPNIVQYIPEESLTHFNPKDKYYGIPFYYQEARDSLAIRQDWLDKLELEVPETVDEFYEVAKAFAFGDPDGNGQQDTVGFSMEVSPNGTLQFAGVPNYLLGAFGLANGWKLDSNGELIPMQIQSKELHEFIGFLRKAYEEGVLDQDFAILKSRDTLNKLEAGKTGVANVNPQQLYTETLPVLTKVHPDAKLTQLLPPASADGSRGMPGLPTADKIVINSKIDPKKQKRILMLMDYMLSDEGYDLVKHGIEGVHYNKISDTQYEQLEASVTDRQFLMLGWFFKRFDPMFLIYKWLEPEQVSTIQSYFDNNAKYVIKNNGFGLVSETATKSQQNIDKKWMDTMVKIIAGQEPMESIDKAIAEWKASGGDTIIKEMNEEYRKLK